MIGYRIMPERVGGGYKFLDFNNIKNVEIIVRFCVYYCHDSDELSDPTNALIISDS